MRGAEVESLAVGEESAGSAVRLLTWACAGGEGAEGPLEAPSGLDWERGAAVLRRHGLEPLLYQRARSRGVDSGVPPDVAARLRAAYFHQAARALARDRELEALLADLGAEGIVPVLVKGAALAHAVYPHPACRSMGDFDLWLEPDEIPRAQRVIEARGYVHTPKATRPAEMQAALDGEVQLRGARPGQRLVELHWGLFAGEWLRNAARPDSGSIRRRLVDLRVQGRAARTPAPEDAIIHLAVHAGLNHQMSGGGVKALVDVALLARTARVDWDELAARAREWRLATVTWLVLDLALHLAGLAEAVGAAKRLRPGVGRRWLLRRFAGPESVLAGRDLRKSARRFVFQLLLVDRPADAGRLVLRSLWPEPAWLEARYGARGLAPRLRHLFSAAKGRF